MHDPYTVAHEIYWPFKKSSPKEYRTPWMTIWHVDPDIGGDDDSCGWFPRPRHGSEEKRNEIKRAIADHWIWGDEQQYGLFNKDGSPKFSLISTTLQLFHIGAGAFFSKDGSRNWEKSDKYIQDNLWSLIQFAENEIDSMADLINNKYKRTHEERIESATFIIYGWLLRTTRPWYKHPKWHFWHWEIQIGFLQRLRRWLFTRCEICGKRFKKNETPHSTVWESPKTWWFQGEKCLTHGICKYGNEKEVKNAK